MRIDCPPTYPTAGCKIVFVGEAPGEEELFFKVGFSGRAGKALDKMLMTAGISRDEIGLTNVSKRAPDGGYDSEHFIETFYAKTRVGHKLVIAPTDELLCCFRLLADELVQVKPNVVVACGNEALKALCNVTGIAKYQGSVLASTLVPGLKVIPLLHPSYILRKAQWQQLYINSRFITEKVLPEGDFPEIQRVMWREFPQDFVSVIQFFDWCRTLRVPWTLDIETRANNIACFAIAFNNDVEDVAICIPIQTTTGPYWSLEEEHYIWQELQWLCEVNPLGPIGHNIFYDMAYLREYSIQPPNMEDTMLLFHCMYPELPKKLQFLTALYTDIPYYKDDGKTWGDTQPDEKLWHYNIKDVIATLRVWKALNELNNKQQEREMYNNHTKQIMPIAFEMQCRGLEAVRLMLALLK